MAEARTYGQVHYFNFEYVDDDGDPMYGYYWEIINPEKPPVRLMGPYSTYLQAAEACQREWKRQCHMS